MDNIAFATSNLPSYAILANTTMPVIPGSILNVTGWSNLIARRSTVTNDLSRMMPLIFATRS